MRFLFVYQDYAELARKLLVDLGARDVELIVARKGADGPTATEQELLEAHRGAQAAACQINRSYRKRAAAYVTFCCEPKKFRFDDVLLREWLVPKALAPVTLVRPRDAFRAAAMRAPRLIVHPDALTSADDLADHRWRFASLAAELLARYALEEQVGPLRDWKQNHGVEFAANGRVSFKWRGRCAHEDLADRSEWHLKEGDRTSAASAARIYFTRARFESGARVVVFYVGPHPADGERLVQFAAQ